MPATNGRRYQKQRTREAILDGARVLMARGEPVSVAAAAAVHGVSRATAYRYFPDIRTLTVEAGLAAFVPAYEDVVAGAATTRERLMAIHRAMIALALEHEPAFRQFLAHTVEAPEDRRSRGARRINYFEQALKQGDAPLAERDRKRLVASLGAVSGIETVIALADVAGLARVRIGEIAAGMAAAILDSFPGLDGPDLRQRA